MENPMGQQGPSAPPPVSGPDPNQHPAMPVAGVQHQPAGHVNAAPSTTVGQGQPQGAMNQPQQGAMQQPMQQHPQGPSQSHAQPAHHQPQFQQPQPQPHQYNPMAPGAQPQGFAQSQDDNSHKGLIIGLVVGLVSLFLLLIVGPVVYYLVKDDDPAPPVGIPEPDLNTDPITLPEPISDVAIFGDMIPSTASINMQLDGIAEPVNMTVRVTEVIRDFVPPESSFTRPAVGNEFAILSLEVQNNGVSEDGLFSSSLFFTDENNTKISESFSFRAMEATKYSPRIRLTDRIAPGAINKGYMLVQIPDDATSLSINYNFKVTVLGNADLSVDELKTAKIF